MGVPTHAQIDAWGDNYVRFWNAGNKAAWVRNWRNIAPGDFRMLDPVGTPEKTGFENCCENSFDLFQPNIRFHVPEQTRFICGNEICWVMENHFSTDGEVKLLRSIESYRFDTGGSVLIRTWYDVPSPENTEIGRIFDAYLPGRT